MLFIYIIACTRFPEGTFECRRATGANVHASASVSRKWKSSATMFRGHLDALHDKSILISLYLTPTYLVMLPKLLSDRFIIIPTDFLVQNFNKIETMFQQPTS